MLYKKNILFVFFLLIVGFSVDGYANSVYKKVLGAEGIQNSQEIGSVNLFAAEGILQPSVNFNTGNHIIPQNLKTGKRYPDFVLPCFSIVSSWSFRDSYDLLRINRLNFSPFYIACHQLII